MAVPVVVRSLARMLAVSCVLFTYVVIRALPFQLTVAPETKFEPVTVSVKPVESTRANVGLIDVSVGIGLSIVNVSPFEVPPPGVGLKTVRA